MTNYNKRLDEIFKTSPIDKEVPEDIWETIYATWAGLWTNGHGEWDEKQPSDIYPLDELLSTQARNRLKQAITSLFKELVAEANLPNEYQDRLLKMLENENGIGSTS